MCGFSRSIETLLFCPLMLMTKDLLSSDFSTTSYGPSYGLSKDFLNSVRSQTFLQSKNSLLTKLSCFTSLGFSCFSRAFLISFCMFDNSSVSHSFGSVIIKSPGNLAD